MGWGEHGCSFKNQGHFIFRWSKKMLVAQSCLTLFYPRTVACQAPLTMSFSRQEYWSGLPEDSLLQGIFLTQESNLHLLHCRQILYHLSHQGNLIKEKMFLTSGALAYMFYNGKILESLALSCLPHNKLYYSCFFSCEEIDSRVESIRVWIHPRSSV